LKRQKYLYATFRKKASLNYIFKRLYFDFKSSPLLFSSRVQLFTGLKNYIKYDIFLIHRIDNWSVHLIFNIAVEKNILKLKCIGNMSKWEKMESKDLALIKKMILFLLLVQTGKACNNVNEFFSIKNIFYY
jgi:hypothetical protein